MPQRRRDARKKTWKHPPRARFWRRSKNGVFLCVRDVCSWTKNSPKYLSLTRICLCTLTFKGDAITRARVVREITVAVCDSLKHPNDTTQLYPTYKKNCTDFALKNRLTNLLNTTPTARKLVADQHFQLRTHSLMRISISCDQFLPKSSPSRTNTHQLNLI